MGKPFAITLSVKSSLANHTGSWRTERPVYQDRRPPCSQACPAGEQIQAWLYDAEDGGYERAWRRLVADNPFPAILGRVCYHPCETACNRAQLDEAVGINSVERFLGDEALRQGWSLPEPLPDTGRRILVVGGGPSGLSAAYHLRLLGHAVEIHDGATALGGMMRYGIPSFRLPRDVLDAELNRMISLGISVRLGRRTTDLAAELTEGGFDAAFVAVGAHLSRRAYIPAGQSARVLDALSLLAGVEEGERPRLGRRVIVYGGGNTAMDAARTARRLGAEEALVVYRRTRDVMPANDIEVAEALGEGVQLRWLSTVTHVDGGRLTLERMRLDDEGKPQPTGEFEDIEGDALVLALGQEVDHSLLDGLSEVEVRDDGVVVVDRNMMTGMPGVFAGGDMVPANRSVAVAVGHGHTAADAVDAWLRSVERSAPAVLEPASFDLLNPWYYSEAPKSMQPKLRTGRQVADFGEVVGGLDAATALFEARRCLSCGNCFGCDNCYGLCPDNAVIKTDEGHGYAIDLDYCKGCGICAAECPAGAITMRPEEG